MDEPRAQRTLVKSPPELWAEISDVDALAGHLGEFGEIRITRADPETTVAWEGDRARGTVELEPTAWGTKVTLTAEVAEEEVAAEAAASEVEVEAERGPTAEAAPEVEAAIEPEVEDEVEAAPEVDAAIEPKVDATPEPAQPEPVQPPPRRGFLARLFGRHEVVPADPPASSLPPEPTPEPEIAPPPAEPTVEAAPVIAAEEAAPAAPEPLGPDRAQEILCAVLDDLGSAHHRPFSR